MDTNPIGSALSNDLLQLAMQQPQTIGARLPWMSKHRQFDRDGNHIPGRVRIGEHSGLRKMMRAARRGKVPQERIGVIVRGMQSAAGRPEVWANRQLTTLGQALGLMP